MDEYWRYVSPCIRSGSSLLFILMFGLVGPCTHYCLFSLRLLQLVQVIAFHQVSHAGKIRCRQKGKVPEFTVLVPLSLTNP